MDLTNCRVCAQLHCRDMEGYRCIRCGHRLSPRQPASVVRCWLLLQMALLAYLPANILPITVTHTLVSTTSSSILSGIAYFWISGDKAIALLILLTSVVLPLTKMIGLALLLVSVQRKSTRHLQQKTRLYQLLERVGRWSMLDVFVVILLATCVQAGGIVSITAGPGILAFAATAILTMLASQTFDPRLIWDALDAHE